MHRWPGNAQKGQTTFGRLSRSRLMSRIRSSGNKSTEQCLVLLLRKYKLYGWRRHYDLVGKPDFVWSDRKLALFVDGCFWHGHTCGKNITPQTNAKEWSKKINRNRGRDQRVMNILRRQGWGAMRIWECQLAKNPKVSINRISEKLMDKY